MTPRERILASLGLFLVLILCLSCNPNPNPQLEGLTPIPTLAPAITVTLNPALEGAPLTEGESAPTPAAEAGDPANGEAIFAQNCAVCHGENAEGGAVGPTLISAEIKAKDDDHYRQVIANGVTGTAMPAWSRSLSAQDIEDLIAFVRSKQ
jgi:mono/diheme cytochrome c family protein